MSAPTETDPAARPLPRDDEQALRWSHLLRRTCEHLGIAAPDADRILDTQALQVGGIDLALHLNLPMQAGEFYADCGRPQPWQEADLYPQLLQDALSPEFPGIVLALHPQSRHLVARSCLPLQVADDAGWLCTTLLLATVGRAREVKQRFALFSNGHNE